MAIADEGTRSGQRPAAGGGADLAAAFTGAMSQLATGVVMVTTEVDGRPWGLTISACCSVSLSPPTLLVSLGERTVSAAGIREARCFGVSVLGERLLKAAQFGSASGAPKFVEHFCEPGGDEVGLSRSPVVAGALAHIDCALTEQVSVADHEVFFGTARSVLLPVDDDTPLLYYGRRYRVLSALGPNERETTSELFYING